MPRDPQVFQWIVSVVSSVVAEDAVAVPDALQLAFVMTRIEIRIRRQTFGEFGESGVSRCDVFGVQHWPLRPAHEMHADAGASIPSSPHQRPARIERGFAQAQRGAPLADDLDLESFIRLGQGRRHVAECERHAGAMPEASGGHPSDRLAVVPNRLVADRVGIGRRHLEA